MRGKCSHAIRSALEAERRGQALRYSAASVLAPPRFVERGAAFHSAVGHYGWPLRGMRSVGDSAMGDSAMGADEGPAGGAECAEPVWGGNWRRGRDSNPGGGLRATYALSKRAPSANSDTSPAAHIIAGGYPGCQAGGGKGAIRCPLSAVRWNGRTLAGSLSAIRCPLSAVRWNRVASLFRWFLC